MKHHHFFAEDIEDLKKLFEKVFKDFQGKRIEGSLWVWRKHRKGVADRIKGYMWENFCRIKTIQEIAKEFSLHPDTIARRFRKKFGITPYKYLVQLKMEYAIHLLNEGYLVKQVSAEVGYASANHFSEVLKKYKQMSGKLEDKKITK